LILITRYNTQCVIFICNDDNLVEKVKDSTIKYADKFIININPSPEVCKDLINYKNKKIVQIVNSKKLATDMYFNKCEISPTILLSINEDMNIDNLMSAIFETK